MLTNTFYKWFLWHSTSNDDREDCHFSERIFLSAIECNRPSLPTVRGCHFLKRTSPKQGPQNEDAPLKLAMFISNLVKILFSGIILYAFLPDLLWWKDYKQNEKTQKPIKGTKTGFNMFQHLSAINIPSTEHFRSPPAGSRCYPYQRPLNLGAAR